MYRSRHISTCFKHALSHFPSCVLTGARQTGKSTFLQKELPDYRYVTFDAPDQRDLAEHDPLGFLDSLSAAKGAILDEIQYVPHILHYLKMDIDRERVPGKWVLTGSQQFHLMKNISESLAGRTALFDLSPFCHSELGSSRPLAELLFTGFYPEPSLNPEFRETWIRTYLQTYLERDIRNLGNVRDIKSFEVIVKLLAARHAQELNISAVSRQSGSSMETIKGWVGLLESSYLLYALPPFHNNLGKRIVKSPKSYFMDSGLAAYLTLQPSADALLAGSMGGAFFEGFVVSEAVKCFFNCGKQPSLYYWRSHDGLEVDLIIQIGNTLYPVEIKTSATPKSTFMDPITRFKKNAEPTFAVEQGLLVCQAKERTALPNGNLCLPWQEFYPWLEALLDQR